MNHKQLNQKISELNQLYADLEAYVEEEKEQRGRELINLCLEIIRLLNQ
jgi:nitrate/nitrite-specific signal transduction histidine kinase